MQNSAIVASAERNVNSTAASIEIALNWNRQLQSGLLSRIQNVSRLKKSNRQACAQIVLASDRYHSEREKKRQGIDKNVGSQSFGLNRVESSSESSTSEGGVKRKKPPSIIVRKWSYNENRRWTKRFFVDPDKTLPEPNADILRRREWEGDMISMDKGRFQPWSKNELNLLKTFAEIVREKQSEENDTDTQIKDVDIDFRLVTQLVQQEISAQNESLTPFKKKHCRAMCDYRIKFLTEVSPSINKGPFTKKESLKIIELLHKHHGHPRWDAVARTLNTKRTPFQCFVYAQSKLVTTNMSSSSTNLQCNPTPWSQNDDELVLKFIAASGPQIVINSHAVTFLSQRFFPHLDKYQILNRCHTSLLNPNFNHRKWNEKEERLLVLGMRLFCESDTSINKVSALFPDRASKAISDKWIRSLDPQYITQPFTPRDDEALLAAVKSSRRGAVNWNDISKIFVRQPRRLYNRWHELANNQDICKMKGDSFIKSMIAQPGVFGDAIKDAHDEHLLNPDDFVVCIRKKKQHQQGQKAG